MKWRWTIKTRRGRLDLGRMSVLYARFWRYVRPHRWKLLGAFGAALGTIGMSVASPWPLKIIFDYILTDKMKPSWITEVLSRLASTPTAVLVWVCAAILAIVLLDALFSYTRDVLLAHTGQHVVGKIRQDLFRHLQTLSPDVFERRRTGDLLMRLTGDILMLRQMLVNALITSAQASLQIIAMIVVMFWLNPTLAALGVASIPIILWSSWRISRKINKATKNQREKEGEVATIAHDVLGAIPIVQAFNREDVEQKRFTRQNRSSIRAGLRTTKLQAKLSRTVAVASAAGMCAILFAGVRSVLDGVMTAGDLLVFVSYLRALNKPLRSAAKVAGQVAKAASCGQRVAEIFAITPSIQDHHDATSLGSIRGTIQFEDTSFRYNGSRPALSDVTFAIEAGQRVAIVGHTGAGKSTLLKLLLRFYDPTEGCVRVDGVDIRDATIESLRTQMGWVHQDTVLFGMTVAENIALGRPDADETIIRAAAREVEAEEFIDALPDGFDTVLGQGGSTLSGGQRQRIALARAMLRKPAILLLDEPATGLDNITRTLVERAWLSSANKATTVVICHRLRNMERFDRILVLDGGRVEEHGTHLELLALDGVYAAMNARERSSGNWNARTEPTAC